MNDRDWPALLELELYELGLLPPRYPVPAPKITLTDVDGILYTVAQHDGSGYSFSPDGYEYFGPYEN